MDSTAPGSRRPRILLLGGLGLILLAWVISASVGDGDENLMRQQSADQTALHIVPADPATFNELHLQGLPAGTSPTSVDATPAAARAASPEVRVVWSVNGKDVHTGQRLPAQAHRRGDQVEARLEQVAPGGVVEELGRASTTIRNADPVIRSVGLRRSANSPFQVEAVVDVADPDGDAVELDYHWLVGGRHHDQAVDGVAFVDDLDSEDAISLQLTARDTDGGLVTHRTAELELANQPPTLDFGGAARLTEDSDGQRWAFLEVLASDPDGDAVEVSLVDPPAGFDFEQERSRIRWALDDSAVSREVRVRVTDSRGGSAERTLMVKH